MKGPHDCKRAWERGLDARRGALSDLELLLLEEDLKHCEACAHRLDRTQQLLNHAAKLEAEEWTAPSLDPDALFERINYGLDLQHQQDALNADPTDDPAADQPPSSPPRAPTRWALLALAAALLLAAGAALATLWSANAPTPPEPPPAQVHNDALRRQPGTPRALDLYADTSAQWTLEGDPDHTLRVTAGTVLIDFVPLQGEALHVQAGDLKAEVVGTVFYVSMRDPAHPQLHVLAGAVEVQTPGATPRLLRQGEATQPPDNRDAQLRQEAAALINLDRHRALLLSLQPPAEAETPPADLTPAPAAPSSAALPQPRRSPRPAPSSAPPRPPASAAPPTTAAPPLEDLTSLRARAREALRQRDYLSAANLHEAWLARLPATSPEAANLHLELTQLYLRRLGRRQEAITHLRRLLHDSPRDPVAAEARELLCELLGDAASQDAACR